VPDRAELFSRSRSLLPADDLDGKAAAAVFGVGSGGSMAALELVKSGVGQFHLVDRDWLEPPNVIRHVCGIRDLGRWKTRAVRDLLLDRNPDCVVHTHETDIETEPPLLATLV
jgi:molybdopterin-synthase adenylyltransferase